MTILSLPYRQLIQSKLPWPALQHRLPHLTWTKTVTAYNQRIHCGKHRLPRKVLNFCYNINQSLIYSRLFTEVFYSDSDSDSEHEEQERKIHVEIKPLNNGTAPISASVDELRATVEILSLSPLGGALSVRMPNHLPLTHQCSHCLFHANVVFIACCCCISSITHRTHTYSLSLIFSYYRHGEARIPKVIRL